MDLDRTSGSSTGLPYGCWRGETAFVIASGPSSNQQDARKAKENGRVIVVNCAVRLCPDADALYAADEQWWRTYKNDWENFKGWKFTLSADAARKYGVTLLEMEAKDGLGRKGLATGGNSGYQATNLAYLLGASRIVLLGFDMQHKDGKHHFHGNHETINNPSNMLYQQWIKRFVRLYEELKKEGVELINCSRESALTIPRANLEDVLRAMGR